MITLQLKEMIASSRLRWGRNITLTEISSKSGISRMTLHRMLGQAGYSYSSNHLDKLCEFFECEIQDFGEVCPTQSGGRCGTQVSSPSRKIVGQFSFS